MKVNHLKKNVLAQETKKCILYTLNDYYKDNMGNKFFFILDFNGAHMNNMV